MALTTIRSGSRACIGPGDVAERRKTLSAARRSTWVGWPPWGYCADRCFAGRVPCLGASVGDAHPENATSRFKAHLRMHSLNSHKLTASPSVVDRSQRNHDTPGFVGQLT